MFRRHPSVKRTRPCRYLLTLRRSWRANCIAKLTITVSSETVGCVTSTSSGRDRIRTVLTRRDTVVRHEDFVAVAAGHLRRRDAVARLHLRGQCSPGQSLGFRSTKVGGRIFNMADGRQTSLLRLLELLSTLLGKTNERSSNRRESVTCAKAWPTSLKLASPRLTIRKSAWKTACAQPSTTIVVCTRTEQRPCRTGLFKRIPRCRTAGSDNELLLAQSMMFLSARQKAPVQGDVLFVVFA